MTDALLDLAAAFHTKPLRKRQSGVLSLGVICTKRGPVQMS